MQVEADVALTPQLIGNLFPLDEHAARLRDLLHARHALVVLFAKPCCRDGRLFLPLKLSLYLLPPRVLSVYLERTRLLITGSREPYATPIVSMWRIPQIHLAANLANAPPGRGVVALVELRAPK